jgi:hypothetical protein
MKSGVLVKVSKQTLSFWYQIEGGEYATLTLKEGNVIPLCFYVNENEFSVGSFAKERCLVNDPHAFTDYFENVKNPTKHFTLVGDSKPYKQLLYFGIENYLSHFIKTVLYKNESIEAYRANFCLRFWFDDDLESAERVFVLTLFKEAGYENVSAANIENHLKSLLSSPSSNGNGRVYISAISNDLYLQLFSSSHEFLGKFKLPELGSDPRAKILAKLILEDIREANPHIYFEEEKEIGFIINHCTSLLSSLTPLIRNQIELSTGVRTDYKVRLSHLEERLAYNRGIEDKVIPQLESILGENGLNHSLVDLFLLGDQINTNYFKEKLTKKFPSVIGVSNSIEAKILKSIFVEIASNAYGVEISERKPVHKASLGQEVEDSNSKPKVEKDSKKGTNESELFIPRDDAKSKETTLPPAPAEVESSPVTRFRRGGAGTPKVGSKSDTAPILGTPDVPNSLTLQDKLAKEIQQKFPDAEVKKVNKDNYVDIFISSVYPKRETHLFFNTSNQEIKIGFYCKDKEFILEVLAKQKTLEECSQGIRPLGDVSFTTVDEAINAALDFLSKISDKSSSPSPLEKGIISVGGHFPLKMKKAKVPPPPPPPPPVKKK